MIDINITKRIEDNKLNKTIDFNFKIKFKSNEILTLFGPSGSGKTTFLNLLSGLIKPDNGFIFVDDVVWYDSEKNINLAPQKRNVGYMFQENALFPNMNVLSNIKYSCSDIQFLEYLLNILEIKKLEKKFPHQLSGGQKQRVALARTIAYKPKYLFLDEPFSAIHHSLKNKVIKEIKKTINEFGITVINVTHDINDVLSFSDCVAVIENGIVTDISNIDDFFNDKNEYTLNNKYNYQKHLAVFFVDNLMYKRI